MKMQVCALYDAASGVYAKPIFTQSTGVAIRSFTDEVNRKHEENAIFNHPEDFALYHLGSYEDTSGEFKCLEKPLRLVTANEVKV